METLKNYLARNSEQTFALLIMTTVATINYFIPYKLVFLNVYFVVIVLGVYHLEVHKAVLGGFLSALLVVIHVYYFPS